MPKKRRLTRKEFPRVRSGYREHGELFVVSASPSLTVSKATCVVSKKVAAKATARNLIKRRVRASLSLAIKTLPPMIIIVQAKRGAATATFSESEKDLISLIQKMRTRHGA